MSNKYPDVILKELATEESPKVSTYFVATLRDSSLRSFLASFRMTSRKVPIVGFDCAQSDKSTFTLDCYFPGIRATASTSTKMPPHSFASNVVRAGFTPLKWAL